MSTWCTLRCGACCQVLCIRGFLAARKHADRILLLVEMLSSSGFPCFKAGPKTVYALRRRFALQATEPQVRAPLTACRQGS